MFSSGVGECRDRYQKTKDQSKNKTDLKKGHPEEFRGDQPAEPFSRPPNFNEFLFLPQGATTSTIQKHFKMLAMLCHPDKGDREDLFKIILQSKKNMADEDARNIYDKHVIEKAEEYMNSKMDI